MSRTVTVSIAPPREPLPVPKSNEKLDLATRAAWLYYVAGNTQNEIAEKLQVSRPVAQRLVAFAVEKNLIRVRVDHRLADCLSLPSNCRSRYGLSMCEVVPIDGDTPRGGRPQARRRRRTGDGALSRAKKNRWSSR